MVLGETTGVGIKESWVPKPSYKSLTSSIKGRTHILTHNFIFFPQKNDTAHIFNF